MGRLEEGTSAAVLRKIVEIADAYQECRIRHDALIEAVTTEKKIE
ncbi:MAG: hypothetical protein ACREI9_05635 [Nitrospiraceae bacterium]